MATFSVMRCLTPKGHIRCLKHDAFLQGNDSNYLRHTLIRTIGVQGYISSSHRHFTVARNLVSQPHLLPAFSQKYVRTGLYSHLFSLQERGVLGAHRHIHNEFFQNRTITSSSEKSQEQKPDSDSQKTPDSEQSSNDSKKESGKESWWRGKNSWRLGLIFLGGTCITWGIGLVNIWGAPQLDPDGNEIKDEFSEMHSVIAYLRRTWKEMNVFKKKIQDPSRDQLLPDPLSYPYIQPPYTLVIELTGVLIHPDWTYSTGWRFKKRPGIDYFLQHVGPPLFEVVIYSQEAGMTADPLVNHLDPQGYIMYRLYRDATRYMDGKHVKDLSCLNREMSRVIMLDCNKEAVSLQPRNSLVLNKWLGEDEDRTLIDLAHFLKTIAASGVEDIRPVLDYYNQFDDPLGAFKDNQRKLQDEEEARQKGKEEAAGQKKGWLSGFGVKR